VGSLTRAKILIAHKQQVWPFPGDLSTATAEQVAMYVTTVGKAHASEQTTDVGSDGVTHKPTLAKAQPRLSRQQILSLTGTTDTET